MKKLEKNIKKNRFNYKLIERCDKAAIYEQFAVDAVTKEVYTVAFEVFYIKISKATEINGRAILGGEKFPGNEDFGKTAWTIGVGSYGGRDNALIRANSYFKLLKEKYCTK